MKSGARSPVPRIPLDLGGVVNVRGEPVPVLDGGTVLQGRPCPPYRYAILLNIDEHRLGVLVTGVSRIERRRPTSTEETAPASDDPPFVRRALLPDGPVGVVDETGLRARVRELLACCYAKANKVWASEPDGLRWEFYRVIEDSETFGENPAPAEDASA